MDRKAKYLWLKDILEHLTETIDACQADSCEERFLADVVERDLEEFRRLFRSVRRDARSPAQNRGLALV